MLHPHQTVLTVESTVETGCEREIIKTESGTIYNRFVSKPSLVSKLCLLEMGTVRMITGRENEEARTLFCRLAGQPAENTFCVQ